VGDKVAEAPSQLAPPLAGGDLQPADLTVPVDAYPGRDQRVHCEDLAALADLEHHPRAGVDGEERERPVSVTGSPPRVRAGRRPSR
jgi:hypothetical protein